MDIWFIAHLYIGITTQQKEQSIDAYNNIDESQETRGWTIDSYETKHDPLIWRSQRGKTPQW